MAALGLGCGLQDLSSLPGDQTQASALGAQSTPLDHQGSPPFFLHKPFGTAYFFNHSQNGYLNVNKQEAPVARPSLAAAPPTPAPSAAGHSHPAAGGAENKEQAARPAPRGGET